MINEYHLIVAFSFIAYICTLFGLGAGVCYLWAEHKKTKNDLLPKWLYLYTSKDEKWSKYECGHCVGQLKLYENRQLPSICPKCGAKMGGVEY